jgi:DNA-binding SARP family transcriptional activator
MSAADMQRMRFAYSPLAEVAESLHMINSGRITLECRCGCNEPVTGGSRSGARPFVVRRVAACVVAWPGFPNGGEVCDDIVLRGLGPVEARADGGWLTGPPQQRLLLAVLALRAGQVVPVGELVDAVWDEEPPPSAQASIQALVTRLRRILAGLPGGGIERCGDGYRLRIKPGVVDVQRFRSLARSGREAGDGPATVAAFDQALALWRGPALADVRGTVKIEAIRSGLAEERLSVMQDRIGVLLDTGRNREAAEELTGLLAEHPLAERLAGMLMVALHRCGRQADALAVFPRHAQAAGR